jgi:hypothetical protein
MVPSSYVLDALNGPTALDHARQQEPT